MLMLSLLACAPTATGTIVLETSGNRTSTEEQWWRFDDQGRPLRLDSRDGDERGEESWTYGAHAHPTAWEWTRAGDGGRTDYTLDADGRLIEMVVGGPSGIVETWTYEGQTTTWQRSRHEVPSLRVETVNYNPEWYLISLQGSEMDAFAGAVDLAEARASEGDYTGAAEACRELAASSDDPRVRQDMYGRASYFSMSLNDARTGQKVSSANTPFLARLYWAEGRALENSGDIEGARRAYTTAANLNAAR